MKKYEKFIEDNNIELIKSILEEYGLDSNDPEVIYDLLEYIENEEKEELSEGLKSQFKPAPLRFGGKGSICHCKNCGKRISLNESKYAVFGGTKFANYGTSLTEFINRKDIKGNIYEGKLETGESIIGVFKAVVQQSILAKDVKISDKQDVFGRIKQFFRKDKDNPDYKKIYDTAAMSEEEVKNEWNNASKETLDKGNEFLDDITNNRTLKSAIPNKATGLDNKIYVGYDFTVEKSSSEKAPSSQKFFIGENGGKYIFLVSSNQMNITSNSDTNIKTLLGKLKEYKKEGYNLLNFDRFLILNEQGQTAAGTGGGTPAPAKEETPTDAAKTEPSTGVEKNAPVSTTTEEAPKKQNILQKIGSKIGKALKFVFPGYKQALWNLLAVNLSGKVYCDPACKYDYLNSDRTLVFLEGTSNKRRITNPENEVTTGSKMVPYTKVAGKVQAARKKQMDSIRDALGLKEGTAKTDIGDAEREYVNKMNR